jgi:hypothetical protein
MRAYCCAWRITPLLIVAVFAFVAQGAAQNTVVVPQNENVSMSVLPTGPQAADPNRLPALAAHRFWDRENDLLFAGMFTSRMLDFASTIHNRNRGLDEGLLNNQIVDNHPLFFGIEVGAAAASIGVSYLFHRTGHHRLERWVSVVHIGVATTGAVRNYALKSPQ